MLRVKTGHRRNYKVDAYPGCGRYRRLHFLVAKANNAYPREAAVLCLEIDKNSKPIRLVN